MIKIVHKLTKTAVTCKIKHLQNICKNVLEPSTSRGYAVDVKCFIVHVTTSYLQYVFSMLKHLQKCFANVLQHFCKCLAYNICKTFRGVYMQNL